MSTVRKSLSRHTSDWSARIEFLKKNLAAETRIVPAFAPERDAGPIQDRTHILYEQLKKLEEASANEIRQISKRCQDLEEFVKAKEIDLQNLKSESVEHRLVHDELRKKIGEQPGGASHTAEGIERKTLDLTDRVNALQALMTSRENSPRQAPAFEAAEDQSYLSRCLAWWNEPLFKTRVPKDDN